MGARFRADFIITTINKLLNKWFRRVRGITNTRRNSKDCSEPPEPPNAWWFFHKTSGDKNHEKIFNRNHCIFMRLPCICRTDMHNNKQGRVL